MRENHLIPGPEPCFSAVRQTRRPFAGGWRSDRLPAGFAESGVNFGFDFDFGKVKKKKNKDFY